MSSLQKGLYMAPISYSNGTVQSRGNTLWYLQNCFVKTILLVWVDNNAIISLQCKQENIWYIHWYALCNIMIIRMFRYICMAVHSNHITYVYHSWCGKSGWYFIRCILIFHWHSISYQCKDTTTRLCIHKAKSWKFCCGLKLGTLIQENITQIWMLY